ncbi:hypothetical protein A2609_03135 [Candidatus Kaiserbacteria bacterium RIFOXYD1_FULL_47_14]|uniref:Uncharacterized protein n=1 Tax=Candidatus Kaiserbacteria bacterium RIFOXYD1_FULL_47_14 TaxID=1798533 RepID=A0A1F6G3T1_9BACT|nr:MAG: hypothetical protein A2609_03135 [Candidatus Kaiserbacteria bacterium RIFOXYD1_FULL_47_14]
MKTTQRGFVVPLLIVIIALLLAGGGAYVYVQQGTTQTSNSQIAGWETYKNLGFEISYPTAWIIDKSSESQGVIWLRTKSRQADLDAKKMTRVFDIEIRVYNTVAELPNNEQDKFSFANWIDMKADEYGFVDRTPIMIDGVSGYKGVTGGEVFGDYLQFVENKGKIYEVGINGKATEEEMNIVKSFKFTK